MRTVALAVFACAASVLGAQEAALDFIVTAGRTAEDPASVPAQVTVISADEIAESGASSLVQVLERVPGVSFMPSMAGPGTETVSMRGFGENSFGRVLILVDGVRQNNPDMKSINWNAVALSDIERIEVLDGSASVLYGNNAVGGVINIITKKGGAGTTISGSVGSFNTNTQKLSHQSSTGWGRVSIAAEHIGTDGYRDRQAAQTVNASVRGTIDLADTLSLTVQGSLADLGYQLPGSLSEAQFAADPTQASNWADEGTELHYAGGVTVEWLPSDSVQVEVPLSYSYKMVKADLDSYPSFIDKAVHTGEARPKVVADLSGAGLPVRLVGGVDLYGAWLDVHTYSDIQRTANPKQFAVMELSAGPYMSANADLLPNLSATAGLRYDTARIAAVKEASSIDDSIVHAAFVYNGGLSYRPLEDLNLYASYGTLFRYPFTDEQAQTSGFNDGFNADLKPETGYNAEAGLSIDLATRISLAGNLYYMQMNDEIAYDGTANVNLDQTRRIGSNIGLNMRPLKFLDIDASYTFVDAVFTAGANNGNYIPLVAKHSAEASVTFMLPAGLNLGSDVTYRGAVYQGGDYANSQDSIPPYFVYGAQAHWEYEREGQKVAVRLIVRNILDTSYAPLVFNYGAYYPAEGRSFSVSVEYRY
jgi:iron complex outermembrane receptor protein